MCTCADGESPRSSSLCELARCAGLGVSPKRRGDWGSGDCGSGGSQAPSSAYSSNSSKPSSGCPAAAACDRASLSLPNSSSMHPYSSFCAWQTHGRAHQCCGACAGMHAAQVSCVHACMHACWQSHKQLTACMYLRLGGLLLLYLQPLLRPLNAHLQLLVGVVQLLVLRSDINQNCIGANATHVRACMHAGGVCCSLARRPVEPAATPDVQLRLYITQTSHLGLQHLHHLVLALSGLARRDAVFVAPACMRQRGTSRPLFIHPHSFQLQMMPHDVTPACNALLMRSTAAERHIDASSA